jgi:hypothetical protein
MHPKKGMIFLRFSKFHRFDSNLNQYFVMKIAYLDYCASF